ncbi:factor-independent urate hydroxylase [Marinitenerispora sediminis]|uniref:Uricase n=1 Tax=Marinitenerispora sediminis TaxID=1931232 RepID=A0A368T185_9ACTN|nr:urate oxidase [Marinitenerispora sediminis]RCV52731.1 urate oxidase [Marinitenerispora sediminis]RCV53694.1 urate oxidase [Marinitenerispora sediminis]RCV56080.1 urate oxidase [Marinitenerispora sediminis]
MAIRLGENQYGKAEVRLVHVSRDSARHILRDLNVTTQLRGDFDAVHTEGDNANCLATDTQKNTVYLLAREHRIGAIEDFALLLARHFVDGFDYVRGSRQEVEEYGWSRITTADGPHDHAFVRDGAEVRTTVVTRDGDREWVVSGVRDLVLLKSTGSEFRGFPKTAYTTLADTADRILATSVTARWRYAGTDADWDASYAAIRATILGTFATTHSRALQQTLYAIGRTVLEARPEVAEIRLSAPNKHHFAVDLTPFGVDNPNEVFYAADRPYGLIEAAVYRDDAPEAGRAWESVPGFV